MGGTSRYLVLGLLSSLYLLSGCGPPEPESSELVVYTTLRPANQDIYLVESSGADPERVTENPGLDYNATFSPDGRWLVFTSERKGNADLYALDLEEGGEPVRLTHHPAMDDAADVSPDGERLVFVSTRDGNADVFTMPFAPDDTTTDVRAENLTRRPAGDFNPAFSPDGTLIAWARQDARPADEPVMSPQRVIRTIATRIFVMGSEGSGPRPVMEEAGDDDGHPAGRMVAGSPAWSPDGRSVYVHGIPFGRDGLLAQLRGQRTRSGIWRFGLSGGPAERVVEKEEAFALSPSVDPGGRIAYATGPPPPPGPAPLLWHRAGEVHSSAPDGTGARVEVDSTHVPLCLAPAFGPDGRVACHGPGPTSGTPKMSNGRPFSRPGTARLARLGDRRVRVLGVRGIFPDLLSDGRLVYGEWLNEATDLARFARDGLPPLASSRLDGTGRRDVFRRDELHPWGPAACDDGSWIAFTVGTPFAAGDVDVWKVRPDGTGAVDLTSDSDANDALPAWSPDCRRIYFRSFRSGGGDIYSMDPEGEDVRRVTDGEGVETAPDVSPDGEWIAFATDRDDAGRKIWIQRIDGSDGRFLEPDRVGSPGIDMHPRFSPDGAWVVFVSDRGGWADEPILSDDPQPFGDLWAVPVEGGDAVRLTDDKWEDGLAQWGLSSRR